ncbi:MAG TPA: hypothetical protein VLL48_00995 [Longimicrobiales bacterium]|nr:hypothetical protein [Longimicrobiales bacterium]
MNAGLPLDAWILLVVAVGAGLGLQLAAWWAHRKDPGGRGPARRPSVGDGSGDRSEGREGGSLR